MGLENRGEGPAAGISQFSLTAEKQYPTLIPQCTIASGKGQAVSGSRFATDLSVVSGPLSVACRALVSAGLLTGPLTTDNGQLTPMKILALETSGQAGSVALMDGDALLAERRLPTDERNAKTLAPAIREILTGAGWTPGEVRLVAVAVGPGSFTGLRVGVTTAKTFAYAVGAEVIGVNTLEVIAAQAPVDVCRLAVVLDAQRQQVFAAEFARGSAGDFNWARDTAIVDNDEWLAKLDPGVAVSGLALEKLVARLPDNVTVIGANIGSHGRLSLASLSGDSIKPAAAMIFGTRASILSSQRRRGETRSEVG